jgi:hypothetical protein
MGIEKIKWWQWPIIGAVLGVMLGYAWTMNGGDAEGLTGGDIDQFQRDIMFQDPRSGKPLISDIVIHPPDQSFEGPVNIVTYKRLATDRKGGLWWEDKHLVARIPFKPGRRVANVDPNLTVEKFLTEAATQHDFVHFHYAWWLEPKKAMGIGAAAGVIVIGVFWPMLLELMIAGGLAPRREPKDAGDKKISLWQTKSSSTPEPKPQPKFNAADEQRLRDLTAAYEQNLPTISSGAPVAASPSQQPAAVQKLEGGTLQPVAPQEKEQDDIEVKGEYYPVLIHHKKPGTDQKDSKK